MKKILIISVSAFLLYACGGVDEQKLIDFKTDVCSCALEVSTQADWDSCNEKRKNFYGELSLDPDDASAEKYNDQMVDCLSEAESGLY